MKSTEHKIELIKENYGKNFKEHLLSQYKLFVGTSENITSKRLDSNKFYLTLNSVLFGISSYLTIINKTFVILLLAIVGIIISFVWLECIFSYKRLNSAKFKVINKIEDYLPSAPFKKEDEHLQSYYKLTKIEKYVPIVFIFLYAIIFIFTGIPILIKLLS